MTREGWERVGQDWHHIHPTTMRFAKISGSERSRFQTEIDGTRVSRRHWTLDAAQIAAEMLAAVPHEPEPMRDVDSAWLHFIATDKGGHSIDDLLEVGFRAGWKAGRDE